MAKKAVAKKAPTKKAAPKKVVNKAMLKSGPVPFKPMMPAKSPMAPMMPAKKAPVKGVNKAAVAEFKALANMQKGKSPMKKGK